LAALAQPLDIKTLFFEKNSKFDWHPGMLIDGASLQVPFMADLVTLANPSSPFSFLKYLHQHRRIYKFYFLEKFHISRKEYNHYCQWVSAQMTHLKFGHRVTSVERVLEKNVSLLKITVEENGHEKYFYARNLVLGIGTTPHMMHHVKQVNNDYIQHSANFMQFNQHVLKSVQSICVIGSGQSAAEIVLELLKEQENFPRRIMWVTRARGFFPMEYSKLGLEHFSPEYMQYFYQLNSDTKSKLLQQQDLMFKGISHKTISDIFDKLYQLSIGNLEQPLQLIANSELENIIENEGKALNRFRLQFKERQLDRTLSLDCDAVVLATGYRSVQPDFLKPMYDLFEFDDQQTFALNENFSIKTKQTISHEIFIQNNSLFSHGVGSPDLGLGCYRNSLILNSVAKKECYPIYPNNVFQSFAAYQ
jgi:lysine N6-hydroxylase